MRTILIWQGMLICANASPGLNRLEVIFRSNDVHFRKVDGTTNIVNEKTRVLAKTLLYYIKSNESLSPSTVSSDNRAQLSDRLGCGGLTCFSPSAFRLVSSVASKVAVLILGLRVFAFPCRWICIGMKCIRFLFKFWISAHLFLCCSHAASLFTVAKVQSYAIKKLDISSSKQYQDGTTGRELLCYR